MLIVHGQAIINVSNIVCIDIEGCTLRIRASNEYIFNFNYASDAEAQKAFHEIYISYQLDKKVIFI